MSRQYRNFELLSAGHTLLEAPLWGESHGLLFSDMVAGGVRGYRGGELRDVWPHRKGIGGLCFHESGALIATGKNVALRQCEGDGIAETTVVLLDAENPRTRFNDLTVDDKGRIYVGTYDAELSLPGALYLIDTDGSARVVSEGTLLSNGLALSPAGDRLLQADTLRGEVIAHAVAGTGVLGTSNIVIALPDEKPDGVAMDQEGNLWVAISGAGRISVYSINGVELDRIATPDRNITSLAFGGEGMSDLYVVSGLPNICGEGRLQRIREAAKGMERFRSTVRY